jgi:hypothetical protein
LTSGTRYVRIAPVGIFRHFDLISFLKEGRSEMLKVTPLAEEKLREFLVEKKMTHAYIRVYINGIG